MNNTITEKRITRATFKSFIEKNKGNLFICVKSKFNGMIDSVENIKDLPRKCEYEDNTQAHHFEYTLGIKGIWLVGDSRDYFKKYEDDLYTGIDVWNCCGSFVVAIIK